MKLLLLIDDYLPGSTRVAAKMFHELAVEFVSRGIDVTVLTPASGMSNEQLRQSEIEGVKLWQFKSGAIKDCSKLKRAVNETLLSYRAWRALKPNLFDKSFDGIVYYSPSIFWGPLVKKLKKYFSCPAYLVLRDFFPQWTIDAGMMKERSLIAQYFKFFERLSYRQASKIGVMSRANQRVLEASQGLSYPLEILRNWAAIDEHLTSSTNTSLREQLGLGNKVIFFYGGNIGSAQDMPNLMRLAASMQPYELSHFVFVGQGDQFELIKQWKTDHNLTNVTIFPSVSQPTFKQYLAEIDVGLFSLSKAHTAHNFPGKLLGYMVNRIPILGSVNSGNDLLEMINDNAAGHVFCNGEDSKLFQAAVRLLESAAERDRLGNNAFTLLKQEFSVNAAAEQILVALSKAGTQ